MTDTNQIDKDDWLRRCEQRFLEMSGISGETAKHFADACWDQYQPDGYSPEAAADEEMTYWDDDE